MGTETSDFTFFICLILSILVKLNNPQMGTETCFLITSMCNPGLALVKLNNPQMGTETGCPFRFPLVRMLRGLN